MRALLRECRHYVTHEEETFSVTRVVLRQDLLASIDAEIGGNASSPPDSATTGATGDANMNVHKRWDATVKFWKK